jgi:mycothiol synthase
VHSEHVVRNYRSTDFNVLLQLKNMSTALAADGVYLSPKALRSLLKRPDYIPEQDLFVAEISGSVVGYLDINAETRIGRAVFEVLVLPEYRQRGIASELYREAAPRAKATGAKVAHVNVREDNTIGRLVLEKTGFRLIRRFCEMTVDLTGVPEPDMSTGFIVRSLRKGEEANLARLQNRCFAGSWGYNPNTAEEIEYAASATDNGRELIFIATDGDRSVGYQWMNIERDEHGNNRGRVSMLGVDPEYWGEGVGRQLMQAGLACLKDRGLKIARLTVDSENAAANALYQSIGFSKSDTSLWYEKALDK